jgi:hypothetical protein
MPEFDEARQELGLARDEYADARGDVSRARRDLRHAEAVVNDARRTLAGDDPEHERLAQRVAAASAKLRAANETLGRVRDRLGAAIDAFAEHSDPRHQLTRLDDGFPILLFPVRLETRFGSVADAATGAQRPQLWVRIYPDTCLIDTFEAELADVEVDSGRAYWKGIWRAGGVEADERSAWAGLVGSHGSGRAGWIVDTYRPANEADRPTKAATSDIILVVATEAALSAAERAAVAAFWRAYWLADGAKAAEQAARAALDAAVGNARATELVELTRPFNLGDRPALPLRKTDVAVSVAFVVLPPVATRASTWAQAPRVDLLPDRFVLVADAGAEHVELIGSPVATPLFTGPDPFAAPADQFGPDGDDLSIPDELLWLSDFGRAVDVGMGFRVDLTPTQAERGFDRLVVLGVRLSADEKKGEDELRTLLDGHRRGRSGFSLVTQGTPTNNTEEQPSGFTHGDDPNASFDDRKQGSLFTIESDPRRKQDGQWLAELLGIDPASLAHVRHAGGYDQRDARAMQTLLWPATIGYFLETMLAPPLDGDREPPPGLVSDADIARTRWFFTNYVSGRGALPAVRIGAQPYGILPTTAFSRISWLAPHGPVLVAGPLDAFRDYLRRLHQLLDLAEADWEALLPQVAAVGHGGDAHQALLGILGLHPNSAEFHSRYAETRDHVFNQLNLLGLGGIIIRLLLIAGLDNAANALLARLGADTELHPAILDLFFLGSQNALLGELVDDRPLSETEPVREWTNDHRNYLRWLADAARTSLDVLRTQSGFVDDTPPRALLYILARHALILGYHQSGRALHVSAGFADSVIAAMRREPAFIHVDPQAPVSESRWQPLYKNEPAISPGEPWTVAAQIAHVLPVAPETQELREQLEALDLLTDTSTARLERALVEHADTCAYRLDAWRLGFPRLQLEHMRATRRDDDGDGQEDGGTRRGVFLGAYAWLESVKPDRSELTAVHLPDDLATVFHPEADPPLLRDSTNGGFVHAPSLNHAVTAAVLRNGYLTHASSGDRDALAVNLSSDRVRLALDVLEGIRQGQSLGALLGYRLERGLHDRHGAIEVDRFVFALRKAFPLRADRLSSTATPEGVAIEAVEARNVVDGVRLVQHVESTGQRSYPFGLSGLPSASNAERAAIDAEVKGLRDVNDALGDLALAEGVHQAVQGNFERAAGTLTTFTTGNHPPEPDVTRTPATGVTLTHRVGLQLRPGLAAPTANPTPRSIAEPALNAWLDGLLPDFAQVACRVVWRDSATGAGQPVSVTLQALRLQPLDLIELLRPQDELAISELDARVLLRAAAVAMPRPDAVPEILYLERGGAAFSFWEVAALVGHLRSLVVAARPLRPGDVSLPTEATKRLDEAVTVDEARVVAVRGLSQTVAADATAYLGTLQLLLDDLPARLPDLVAGIDDFLDDAVALLERGARFGVPRTVWTFAETWRRERYTELVARLRARVAAWDDRLVRFGTLRDAYDALPLATPNDERFAALQQMESVLSTTLQPLPADPATLRTSLDTLHDTFFARRNDLHDVAEGVLQSLSDLYAAVASLLPLTAFDADPFELSALDDAIAAFARELAAAVKSMRDEIERRNVAAQDALTLAGTLAPGSAHVKAVQDAAKALLGEQFLLVPEFTLTPAQGAEWQQALTASGSLLAHLTSPAADPRIPFPVDEWLNGTARVRTPLRHFEQASIMAEALGATEPELVPIQLPHTPGEGWLALNFAAGQSVTGERLLYTAHYTTAFNPAGRQCGLLFDEWTEVVPGSEQSTGLTFNYDRPNCEAPQSFLLVTPATWDGGWQWDDLVEALYDTLRLAKVRAIEPDQIDTTAYARFLPATVMASTTRGISIAAILALNNGVGDLLAARGHDA